MNSVHKETLCSVGL